jgi:spore coat protein A
MFNYLLRDQNEMDKMGEVFTTAFDPSDFDKGRELELILADRSFDAAGNLIYSTSEEEDPSVSTAMLPEYFGTHMLVNAAVWPTVDVPAGWMRLRLLNGMDSRMAIMQLTSSCGDETVPMWLIGRDQGFLNEVVPIGAYPVDGSGDTNENVLWNEYLFLPNGARADVLVNFEGYAGCELILTSTGDSPFGLGGIPVNEDNTRFDENGDVVPTGEIMKFVASKDASNTVYPPAFGKLLKTGVRVPTTFVEGEEPRAPLPEPDNTRAVFLSEITEDIAGGRLMATMGSVVVRNGKEVVDPNTGWCDDETFLSGGEPMAEIVKLGATEDWVIYNISPDGHPWHIHLVWTTILKRCPIATPSDALIEGECGCAPDQCEENEENTECVQNFVADYAYKYTDLDSEDCIGQYAQENGPLDLVVAYEGYATVIRAHFDRPGTYVHHCHILGEFYWKQQRVRLSGWH